MDQARILGYTSIGQICAVSPSELRVSNRRIAFVLETLQSPNSRDAWVEFLDSYSPVLYQTRWISNPRRELPHNFPASGYSQEAIGFLRAGDGGRSSENRFTMSRTDKTGIHLWPRLKSNWD